MCKRGTWSRGYNYGVNACRATARCHGLAAALLYQQIIPSGSSEFQVWLFSLPSRQGSPCGRAPPPSSARSRVSGAGIKPADV